jgi:predicted double-glycine peptidase
MKIKIPYFKQDTNYSCGAASVQMILRFFGIIKSEEDLIKELKTEKEDGTSHEEIIKIIRQNNLFCYVNDNSNFDEIKMYLNKNLPVLVNYIETDDDEGHYAVVVGINEEKIILNDPWHGEDFELNISKFENRWQNSKRHERYSVYNI